MARSSAYPSFDIQTCYNLVSKVYSDYGNSKFVSREDVAKSANIAVATVQMKVSSCVQYGLLEMKSKVGYRPTNNFIRIYKPKDEIEKREALIESFKTPPLYVKLIEDFEGKPIPKSLSTLLFRDYSISENASDKAAKIFIDNANSLGLIQSDKLIIEQQGDSYEPVGQLDKIDPIEDLEDVTSNPRNPNNSQGTPKTDDAQNDITSPPVQNNLSGYTNLEILLTDRKKAVLSVPDNISAKDIGIIIYYVKGFGLSMGVSVKELDDIK